jgi:hypothetical protein
LAYEAGEIASRLPHARNEALRHRVGDGREHDPTGRAGSI